MIDHIRLSVSDYDRAKDFYIKALAPLDAGVIMEATPEQSKGGRACGFGREGKPTFWIAEGGPTTPHLHLAFTTRSRSDVDAFYKAAIGAGGQDNGAPGIRAQYHPNYYAAFVLGPDGHNIEAVCQSPA